METAADGRSIPRASSADRMVASAAWVYWLVSSARTARRCAPSAAVPVHPAWCASRAAAASPFVRARRSFSGVRDITMMPRRRISSSARRAPLSASAIWRPAAGHADRLRIGEQAQAPLARAHRRLRRRREVAAQRGVVEDVAGQGRLRVVRGLEGGRDLAVGERAPRAGHALVGHVADEVVREVVRPLARGADDRAALQLLQGGQRFAGGHAGGAPDHVDVELAAHHGGPGDQLAGRVVELGEPGGDQRGERRGRVPSSVAAARESSIANSGFPPLAARTRPSSAPGATARARAGVSCAPQGAEGDARQALLARELADRPARRAGCRRSRRCGPRRRDAAGRAERAT